MSETNKIKIVLVRPGEEAEITEIENSIEELQKLVGGYIETYYPFDDDAVIVCNDEGKLAGLPLNRAIFAHDGTLRDIICGTFFICYAPFESENFESLPDEMAERCLEAFKTPEMFIKTENGISVLPL